MISQRTAIRLSDGRELIYFDETRDADRRQWSDTRQLPPPPPTSQLRYDPLVDEWVAVAAHRQTRTFLPPSDRCPLCPATPEFAGEIPAPDYDVVVFENQFPSFSDRVAPDEITEFTDMVPVRPGVGRKSSFIWRIMRQLSSDIRSRTVAASETSEVTVARRAFGGPSSKAAVGSCFSIAGSCLRISSTT